MEPSLRRPACEKRNDNLKYTGVLAEPIPLLASEIMERYGQPMWFTGSGDDWQSVIAQVRGHEDVEWRKRENALGAMFGIDINRPPDPADPWHRLAFALAEKYVPAFERGEVHDQYFKTRRAKKRVLKLSPEGTLLLALGVYNAMLDGLTTRDQIARVVNGIPKWRQGTPPELARLPETSATERSQIDTLSFNSARALIPKLRSTWKDVLSGRADTFQCQVLAIALGQWSWVTGMGNPQGDTWRVVFGLKSPSVSQDWIDDMRAENALLLEAERLEAEGNSEAAQRLRERVFGSFQPPP